MKIFIKDPLILDYKDQEKQFHPYRANIVIEDDQIADITNDLPADLSVFDVIIHASHCVALPGLINAHNHSPMSLLRSFSDDLRLMEWLNRKMLPAEANMNQEDIYWGALLGIAEMIKSGTTAYADMYIHMDQIAQAVHDSGIRASLTRGLVFLDDDGGQRLREGIDLVKSWSGKADGRITTMMGPHAPYTCPPDQLKEVMEIAKELQVPIHIHLAETQEEAEKINHKYGKSPTEYLYDLGLFDGDYHVLLAHAVHLDDHDIALLQNMKGGVAHNPFSNMKLGCGIAPVYKFLEKGILVGLGTDGAGSATSLDLFKEMKMASGLQKLDRFDPAIIDAHAILRMVTINGSTLLQMDDQVGKIEVGKKADLILVNINQPHLVPHHDLVSLLVYSAFGQDVMTTIVNGKILMKNRELLTIDEERLLYEAQQRAKRIVEGV
ncbi:amidohydrolase [Thermoactinomyces sp. CICC 10521]|uniref:amidohydrolase n=1 Tax=Thermoactinomyces sp. CICC 10521 TaxID=2767426 RepID=UPI0018DD2D3F|nr:amidohydrolase [Thermoactinomyces sp. CICC 10521]MBH8609333.1 amidohydrolase [Thermoactinomyces sp. CICC 10521]